MRIVYAALAAVMASILFAVPAAYSDEFIAFTDLGNSFKVEETGAGTDGNDGDAIGALHSFFSQNSLLVSEEFDQERLFIQSPRGGSIHVSAPYVNVSHGVNTPPALGLTENNEFDLQSGTAPVLAIIKSLEPTTSLDISQIFEPKKLVKTGNNYQLNTHGNTKNILNDVPNRQVSWHEKDLTVSDNDRTTRVISRGFPTPSGTVIFDVKNLELDGATLHVDYAFRSKVLPVASPYDLMDLEHTQKGFFIHRDNSFNGGVNVLTGSTSISELDTNYKYKIKARLNDPTTPMTRYDYTWTREVYDNHGSIWTSDVYYRTNGLIDTWPHRIVVSDGYNRVVSDSIRSHIPVVTDSNKMERWNWGDYVAEAQRSSIESSGITSVKYELHDDLPAKSIVPDITTRGKAVLNNDVDYIIVDHTFSRSSTTLRITAPADQVVGNFLNINIPNRNNLLNTPWTITANNTVMAAGIITDNGGSSLFEGLSADRKAVMFSHYMEDRNRDWKLNLYTESIVVESSLDPELGGMVILDERNNRWYDNSTVLAGMRQPDNVLNGNEIITPILYAKLPFNSEITIDDVHIGNHRDGDPDMSLSYLAGEFSIGDDMYVPFITGYQTVFLTIGDNTLLFDYADISSSYTSSVFTDLEPERIHHVSPHQITEGRIDTSLSNFIVARNDQKIPVVFTVELDAELELRNQLITVAKTPPPPPPPPRPRDPLTVMVQTFVNGYHVADKQIHFDDHPVAFTDSDSTRSSVVNRVYTQTDYNIARYTYEDALISGSTSVQAQEGDIIEFRVLVGVHGITDTITPNIRNSLIISTTPSGTVSGHITISDASIQIG